MIKQTTHSLDAPVLRDYYKKTSQFKTVWMDVTGYNPQLYCESNKCSANSGMDAHGITSTRYKESHGRLKVNDTLLRCDLVNHQLVTETLQKKFSLLLWGMSAFLWAVPDPHLYACLLW